MLKDGWTPAYQGLVDKCVRMALVELDEESRRERYLADLLSDGKNKVYRLTSWGMVVGEALLGAYISLRGFAHGDSTEMSIGAGTVALAAGSGVVLRRQDRKDNRENEWKKEEIKDVRDKRTAIEGDLGVYRRYNPDDMIFWAPEDHLGEQKERLAEGLREMPLLNLPSYGYVKTRRDYFQRIKEGKVFMNGKSYPEWHSELQRFAEEKYKNCELKKTILDDFDKEYIKERMEAANSAKSLGFIIGETESLLNLGERGGGFATKRGQDEAIGSEA